MKRFNSLYGRPVIPFYRTTLYELVQVRTHIYTHTHMCCALLWCWDGMVVAVQGHCTCALLCFAFGARCTCVMVGTRPSRLDSPLTHPTDHPLPFPPTTHHRRATWP